MDVRYKSVNFGMKKGVVTEGGFARVDLDQKELGCVLQVLPSTHTRQNAVPLYCVP